ELSKDEAKEFLRKADEFFSRRGIIFIYPLHGGDMGRESVKKLSYGKFNWHDSLAPEFETYETIRELANRKKLEANLSTEYGRDNRLKNAKIVIEYTSIGFGQFYLNRSVEDDVKIIEELKPDWIYLGFRYYRPIPSSPEEKPGFFSKEEIEEYTRQGYTLAQLKEAIKELKERNKDVIFTAGLGIEYFYSRDIDPITREVITPEKAWQLALNPKEYGFNMSKEEFQCWWGKTLLGSLPPDFNCSKYDYREAKIYFPDVNKEEVRELYLHKAMALIDAGADAIWIDLLDSQAKHFYRLSRNRNHHAIKRTFESISKLVDEIHRYGLSKGKRVYVGSWPSPFFHIDSDIPRPNYDFVVVTPTGEEVLNMEFDEEKWNTILSSIRKVYGEDIVILLRLDVGFWNSPAHVFSQHLTPSQQRKVLKYMDDFCSKHDILFSYPVFGLYMGPWEKNETKVLAWRSVCWETLTKPDALIISYPFSEKEGCGFEIYDSLAPEFQTYGTIKELIQKRKSNASSEEILVIAGIPFAEAEDLAIFKPSWKEIEETLPVLKEIGVNAIFIWAPYEHRVVTEGEVIAHTESKAKLKLSHCVHVKDYLKPDPERGSEEDFLHMIETAHSLGIKVIPQLQITVAMPGDFVYEEHPEWLLRSTYGGFAVFWPWPAAPYGYVVNKAHPELIKFVTDVVIPHWIRKWKVDGIYLDSPTMGYCDSYIEELCKRVGVHPGYECLTPVEGYYSPENLVKEMKYKIKKLEEEMGRKLIFSAELSVKTWRDMPDDTIAKACRGKVHHYRIDPRVDRTLGKYLDWVLGYTFRGVLKDIYHRGELSYSENYVKFLEMIDSELEGKYTETAKFVNMWVYFHEFVHLLKPEVADCFITLQATAPGRVVWIGVYQLPPQDDVVGDYFGYNSTVLRYWYKKLLKIKREYRALQSNNIEDALVAPKVKGVIAYNRWDGNESVTVIVNLNDKPVDCLVRTRFEGEEVEVYDVLSGEKFRGNPNSLEIKVPARTPRILVSRS
ncbi:hypothetical protein DRN46_06770, partial [Thermococci archaeon]